MESILRESLASVAITMTSPTAKSVASAYDIKAVEKSPNCEVGKN